MPPLKGLLNLRKERIIQKEYLVGNNRNIKGGLEISRITENQQS